MIYIYIHNVAYYKPILDNTYMFNSIWTMAIYPNPIFLEVALDIFGFTVVHVSLPLAKDMEAIRTVPHNGVGVVRQDNSKCIYNVAVKP
jgi:hypothetical protein